MHRLSQLLPWWRFPADRKAGCSRRLRARRSGNRRSRRRARAARSRGASASAAARGSRTMRRAAHGPGRTRAPASTSRAARSTGRREARPGLQGAGGPLVHVAPAEAAARRRVRGDLPFDFGGEPAAGPARPGIGLPPAHVHGALVARRAHGRPKCCCSTEPPVPWRPRRSARRGAARAALRPAARQPLPALAAARAPSGRSRRRRRTRRTGSRSRAARRSRTPGTSTRAQAALLREGEARRRPGPSSHGVAGTSSGSRVTARRRQLDAQRQAERLRHHHQLLAAQVFMEQREPVEVEAGVGLGRMLQQFERALQRVEQVGLGLGRSGRSGDQRGRAARPAPGSTRRRPRARSRPGAWAAPGTRRRRRAACCARSTIRRTSRCGRPARPAAPRPSTCGTASAAVPSACS